MEIIVGRRGDQPFQITDKSVSGKHVKLTTMPDGKVQVEDLGSTNGTFINGIRIIKTIVPRNADVQLGSYFTFRVSDVIPDLLNSQSRREGSALEYDPEILRQFEQLESVWNAYQKAKIEIQKSNASKGFMRMMPTFCLAALGYLISCIPVLADYRTVITLTGLGVGIFITWISYKSATTLPEKMEKLNQQFQIDYVCPKCKQFLGFIPYEGLKNRRQCSACKTKWVK